MKNRSTIHRLITGLCLSVALLGAGGCASYTDKLQRFDELGIVQAQITGKFSNTTYTREEKDGVITSTLDHNNAWVPKVRIVRQRPAPEAK